MQQSISLVDIIGLALAGAALVIAVFAAAFSKKQADHTKRQADSAAQALRIATESNDIAAKALAESAAVREIAHREWHRNAQPAVTVGRGKKTATPRGKELVVETDQDLDTVTLELAEGTPATKVSGLSVSLDETLFNFNPRVTLRNVKAGTPAHPAIWLVPGDAGVTVHLRCTVTIGEETWGPTIQTLKYPGSMRIITA